MQCLHTSDDISQRMPATAPALSATPAPGPSAPSVTLTGRCCSMNATCRHVSAPSPTELSYDIPVSARPSSGTWFHSLHATSHALQPMHTDVSVKNPIRGWSPG